jgi:hypothetical protein
MAYCVADALRYSVFIVSMWNGTAVGTRHGALRKTTFSRATAAARSTAFSAKKVHRGMLAALISVLLTFPPARGPL